MMLSNTNLFPHHSTSAAPTSHHPPLGGGLHQAKTTLQSPINQRRAGDASLQVQERRGQMKHSESLEKLMSCEGMDDTMELCEVFVILGPNEESLKTSMKEAMGARAAETVTSEQQESTSLGLPERANLSLQSVESSYLMVADLPLRKEPSKSGVLKVKPDIIDTYPSIYQDLVQYEDSAMHQLHPEAAKIKEQYLYLSNIQSICFPDGYYIDTDFTLDKIKQAKQKVMHFSITQSSGDKKFLTCLEFKELLMVSISDSDEKSNRSPKRLPCLVPRILLLVSRLPFFTTHMQLLSLLYADLQVSFVHTFAAFHNLHQYSLEDCFQLASSQQKPGALEFYVSAFIHHYRIDGSHLQVEVGKAFSVSHSKGEMMPVIKYVNSFERRYGSLRIENYEFQMLFQRVRPQLLMQIFVALLHERKVILILGGYGDLNSEEDCCKNGAIIIETLLNLMYPLQWNFTNISNLIPSMIDYLEAPFPFILCVSRSLWRQIYETRWSPESCPLGDETLAFDLDSQKVYVRGQSQSMSPDAHLPELPQPYTQLLIQQLERQMLKTAEVRSLDISEEVFWKQFTLKVKQQFLNFLIFLINTFENFYNQDGLVHYPRGNSANEIFNFTDYMQNVQENRGFFKKFVQTQAFINFIEQAHTMQPRQDSDTTAKNQSTTQIFEPHLDFFKLCTRKLSKENIQAVRQMQDEIIANILTKYTTRTLSYPLEKCLTLYEAQLKLCSKPAHKPEETHQHPATLSIISKLDHDRIIRMQPFDPKAMIHQRYNEQMPKHQSRRGDVKQKGVANSIDLRAHIDTGGGGESSLRMVLGGGVGYPLRGGRDDLYFTGAATPMQLQSRAISQHAPLSRVIKVEDNMDVEEDSVKHPRLRSQEPHQHLRDSSNVSPPRHALGSPSDEGETTNRIDLASNDRGSEGEEEEAKGGGVGIMGFFKKTFSSVKKTFESTFNQQKPPTAKGRGARPKSRLAEESSRRPSLLLDDNDLQQSSPRMENMKSRVRFANEGSATVVNRATRSQTFHVTSTKNQKQDDQEGGFFANLFGFSARKQRNEENLDDNLRMNQTQQVANSQGRHKLNNSGFFVFNEEDMKKMTEMSPKDATARSGGLRATSLDFPDIDALPKPKIKGQSIFTTGGNTYQSNRLRSISYQQPGGGFSQTQSGLRLAFNDKRYLEKERYVEESLQLIDQYPQKGQSNKNVMFSPMIGIGESRQISGAFQSQAIAKSEVRKNQPPLVPQTPEQRLLVSQSTTSLMHKQRLLFNNPKSLGVQNQLSLIKEDPLNLSAQGGDSANPSPTAANASQKVQQNTSDFEAIYKQSIEGTKFAPKQAALLEDKKVVSMKGHSGKAQTFNIWKSRSGKVELKGGSTPHAAYMTQSQVMNPQPPVIQVNMTALAKPPKQPGHPSAQVSLAAKQRKPLRPEEKKQPETIARRQFVEQQSSRQQKLHMQGQTLSPPNLKQNDTSVLSEENTTSMQVSIDQDGARGSASAAARGLNQFRYVMSGTKGKLPFDRGLKSTIGGLNSSQNIIKKTSPQSGAKHEGVGVSLVSVNNGLSAHRRHISQGMTPSQSITIGIQPPPQQIQALSTEPPLPNMTLENIEPDEDDQENFALCQGSGGHLSLDIHGPTNQPSFAIHLKGEDTSSISRITHKQIENMQVGRVRRKSGAAASHSITVPTTTSASQAKQEPSSGKKMTIPTTLRQIWGKLEYTNRSPESRQVKVKSPSTKKKEAEEEKVQIVIYKHIQAKTVESNSSESDDLSVQDVGTVGMGLPESHNSIFYPPLPGVNPRKYLEEGGHLRDSSEVQDVYQNRTGDYALDQTKQIVDLKKHHSTAAGGSTAPHRVHSLSQYADHNQAKRLRPTFADLRSPFQAQARGKVTLPRQNQQEITPVSSINNAQEAFSKEGVAGGASSPHQRFGGHHPPSAGSNAPTNNGMIKPLNKITWDSFSQIAKLSGDVDHEPSTPKSGRGGIKNSSDEDNEIE